MKPKWEFTITKWAELGMWMTSIGLMMLATVSIGYFLQIYNPKELIEYGDIGWQVFYEDFPYYWLIASVFFLITGSVVWLKIGDNYKKSWQKNLLLTIIIVFSITGLILLLDF
jgi:uncharacterized membrane protein